MAIAVAETMTLPLNIRGVVCSAALRADAEQRPVYRQMVKRWCEGEHHLPSTKEKLDATMQEV